MVVSMCVVQQLTRFQLALCVIGPAAVAKPGF